ncbi:hypothetical protein ACLOJK_041314 [Asimina triloba]
MRAPTSWRKRPRGRREKKLRSGLTSSTYSAGTVSPWADRPNLRFESEIMVAALLSNADFQQQWLEYGLLEELVSMAEAGGDGLLGGERVLIADGGEQLVSGLKEDSGVGGFRPNGAIGGDEGGDAPVEGFDGLVEGEGIVVGELVMVEQNLIVDFHPVDFPLPL